MKGLFFSCVLAGSLVILAHAQSPQPLGDVARALRSAPREHATKSFDNDNIPKSDKLNVVGPEEIATTSVPDNDTEVSISAERPDERSEKQLMVSDLDAQKKQLDLLSRELDVLNREYRLRAASYYADAGNRLRDPTNWDKEDAQFKQQIAAKQKELDSAKQHLENVQEQARKAGVPAKLRGE